MEDVPREDHSTLQQEENIPTVSDSEVKKGLVKASMIKEARKTRKGTMKKPICQSTKAMRIKRVGNSGTWFDCAIRILKWWTMTELNQPYSCAANRYAKFKSNRRFKPGD